MLCICSRWGGLSVGALDTMGNIAGEIIIKDPVIDHTSSLLLTTVCQGVSSQDRAFVLRSLEVLNKLALNELNEDVLCSNIDQSVSFYYDLYIFELWITVILANVDKKFTSYF